jgi:glycosyltransferase involved in cell wall biosynthesis
MKTLLIDEFTRIGGGQVLSKLLLDYFNKKGYETVIETDKLHPYLDYQNIVETPYRYKENMHLLSLFYYVRKTRNFINKTNEELNAGLSFNSHPNMFIYNANINYLHGFSFLDPITDENGIINNKFLLNIIRKFGIYKNYNKGYFIANSKYTLEISKKLFPELDIIPKEINILYTPVNKGSFLDLSKKNKKLILSIGRINLNKNYDLLLEIAKKNMDFKFVIAGAMNKGDEHYYWKLMKKKSENVVIIPNINEVEKTKLLLEASIYLHLNRKEHYGVSVLEGMSFGLIPVVPKSGGPWIDLIEEGKFGYGYTDVTSAIECIKNADFNRSSEIWESVDRFSFEKFYTRLDDLISKTIN